MRALHVLLAIAILVLAAGPATVQPVAAQGDGTESCLQLVERLLSDLGTNCANLGPNSACYGSSSVSRSFVDQNIQADIFSEVGDQTELTWLSQISTAPLDLETSEWGLAVVNTRANVHNALDDEVTYILFGGVEVENRVAPDAALLPVDPVNATTLADADVYRQPDATSEHLGTAPGGAEVQIDAISPDNNWLRILFNDGEVNYSAWIDSAAIDTSVDISSLPVIDENTFAPMQDIYLRNDFDTPACPGEEEMIAPGILVQAPEGTQVDIRINDVDIRLESTAFIHILAPGNLLQIVLLDGLGFIFPGTPREVILPPGHRSSGCINPQITGANNDLDATCPFSPPDPLTQANIRVFNLLNLLPVNILRYRIVIPIIIGGSGVGTVIIIIIIPAPSLRPVCRLCAQGRLSDNICQRYRCPVP